MPQFLCILFLMKGKEDLCHTARKDRQVLMKLRQILPALMLFCCLISCMPAMAHMQDLLVSVQCQEAKQPAEPSKSPATGLIKPEILSRHQWKASPSKREMKPLEPRYLTIHHTASLQKKETPLEEKLRALQVFSQNPSMLDTGKLKAAWPDIPYHFYINWDGAIGEGRELAFTGDTNTDYDPSGHILIAVEGNFEIETPTTEQMQSLCRLLSWLASRWLIDPTLIKGHQDYTTTLCPGKNLESKLPEIQHSVKSNLIGEKFK
jgi:hypothetical protein